MIGIIEDAFERKYHSFSIEELIKIYRIVADIQSPIKTFFDENERPIVFGPKMMQLLKDTIIYRLSQDKNASHINAQSISTLFQSSIDLAENSNMMQNQPLFNILKRGVSAGDEFLKIMEFVTFFNLKKE
jgi:hypothetical protein